MTTVSPSLVLGLCILGACVATIIGYALSRLLRTKVLNEHEESTSETNPFHDFGREQKEYMAEVRRRVLDGLWEGLRGDLRSERETRVRIGMEMVGIRGGGSAVVGSRHDYTGAVYDEPYPSDSGSGSGPGSAARAAHGYHKDVDLAFEQGSGSTFLEVPLPNPRRPMSKESRGSLLIDDWEKQNGAFSCTFEGIAAGGLKLDQHRWTK